MARTNDQMITRVETKRGSPCPCAFRLPRFPSPPSTQGLLCALLRPIHAFRASLVFTQAGWLAGSTLLIFMPCTQTHRPTSSGWVIQKATSTSVRRKNSLKSTSDDVSGWCLHAMDNNQTTKLMHKPHVHNPTICIVLGIVTLIALAVKRRSTARRHPSQQQQQHDNLQKLQKWRRTDGGRLAKVA